jgi:hypothetical protein
MKQYVSKQIGFSLWQIVDIAMHPGKVPYRGAEPGQTHQERRKGLHFKSK